MPAINIDDLRAAAKRRLPRVIFEFIDGGAQDETTLRANREDFQKRRFRTRTVTDVSTRDQSTCTIEEITSETTPPKWFQPYVLRDRELTKDFIERARASRCTALVLTVDTKVQGPRERDMRNGFTVPPRFSAATLLDFARHYSWLFDVALGPRITFRNLVGSKAASTDAITITRFIAGQYDLSVSWRDVEWFKSVWGGPVLLKGILTAEDAKLAVNHGVDGVIVSNHGGRHPLRQP